MGKKTKRAMAGQRRKARIEADADWNEEPGGADGFARSAEFVVASLAGTVCALPRLPIEAGGHAS